MIYLLHGDDTASSRKFLNGITEGMPITILDGKNLTPLILEENVVSMGLFDAEKAVIVENLLSKNAKKKEFIEFLNKQNPNCIIVLWEDKKLAKMSFSSLTGTTVKEFLLPQYYFQFLDSLAPKNKKIVFEMFQKLLDTYAPELLLFSLLKRIRQLVVLAEGGMTEDFTKMSPWQLQNLKRQLQMWSKEGLLSFYKALSETEIKLKTGKLPVSLSKHLDIVILTKLT